LGTHKDVSSGDKFIGRPVLRFDTDAVIHSSANPLFAAEITLGCLHGNMPKQELNRIRQCKYRVEK